MKATLENLRGKNLLGPLDEHCAKTLCRLAGDHDPDVLLAAAMAVRQVGLGHVCAHLPTIACQRHIAADDGVTLHEVEWPEPALWLAGLRESPLVGAPHDEERRPLVLDSAGRLYLRRYFEHEERLASSIRARAAALDPHGDMAAIEEALGRLFGRTGAAAVERDEQRDAARTAATRRLCVISGGPGTGKTSTVVKILALLVEQRRRSGARPPRVVLLAPTGKAAMRLTESIQRAKDDLACSEDVRDAIPKEASTIHRALRSIEGSGTRFHHDATRPLRADVVLVDEASMVDLALMSRLVEAVPPDARLILLGDKDQLASVEAGAVLGELCAVAATAPGEDAAAPEALLSSSVVHLTRSWRYPAGSGIAALARAINGGDTREAVRILGDAAYPDVERCDPAPGIALSERLREDALAGATAYLEPAGARGRLRELERFRVLCAHRRGPHGVVNANLEIEALLADAGLVRRSGPTYAGRPIIITRNDYQLQLFNGDVGTIIEKDGKLLAAFVASAKSGEASRTEAEDGTERHYSPARLPPHETVFAMTIHKSQGSEFEHVAVLLGDRSSPLLTRELLYTAVTRAKKKVTLYATEAVIAEAVARRTERGSGLRDALRGAR